MLLSLLRRKKDLVKLPNVPNLRVKKGKRKKKENREKYDAKSKDGLNSFK